MSRMYDAELLAVLVTFAKMCVNTVAALFHVAVLLKAGVELPASVPSVEVIVPVIVPPASAKYDASGGLLGAKVNSACAAAMTDLCSRMSCASDASETW